MNIGTNKCYCYQKETKLYYPYDGSEPRFKTIEYCTGTKEYDSCSCGGDPNKCDFYKDKRREKKMNTAEMWLKAQKDGEWYICDDVIYNKNYGFVGKKNLKQWFSKEDEFGLYDVDKFLSYQWSEYTNCNIMTKEEAEEKFNIKIVG